MAARPQLKTAPVVQFEPRSKGERTRERILDLTQEAVVLKGLAATSIEELVEAAGITKSGFFYHFRDKNDLARQLLERHFERNSAFVDGMVERARELHEDPLHSFLIFLKLYAEAMRDRIAANPGCIVVTMTFQDLSWDREARRMTLESAMRWRTRFVAWLEEIAEAYPPKGTLPLEDLADAILTITYGGITLANILGDDDAIARQAMIFRETARLYFLGA